MKLMYFFDDGQRFGGAANTLLQQAVLMKKSGCEVQLVVSDYMFEKMSDKYAAFFETMNVIYLPFQISSTLEDIDVVCLLDNYWGIKEKICEFKPDILHSIQINPVVELVARELKISHVMSIYPLLADFFSIDYLDVFPKFQLCDSNFWAEKWAHYLNTDSQCIRTVVNTGGGLKDNLDIVNPHYICVGDIYKGKNQFEVIKAFEIAKKNGVIGNLSFYGHVTGTYAEKCKEYIETNNLGDVVRVKGFKTNMTEVYKNADVLICGSVRESYPNVVSEALAKGLIVISTPVGGVPEVIKDGVNGYLTEDFSAESISDKIICFDRERTTYRMKEIQRKSYETYIQFHSPESVSKELLRYYQRILHSQVKESVRIENVRETFEEILGLFQENRDKFSDARRIQEKLWHIYHVRRLIKGMSARQVYIWGTGKLSIVVKEIIEVFFEDLILNGFIDSYKTGTHCDLHVYPPTEILKKRKGIVFLGITNGQEEVIEELEENGKICNKDYFMLVRRVW